MSILTWIEDKKRLKVLNAPKHSTSSTDSSKGLWTRCDKCGVILYIKHLKENQRVCFSCSYHLQMMSGERIENLLDKTSVNGSNFSTWRPLDETVSPCDPLKFHDQKAYTDRLQDAQERTGLQDAIQTGTGMIDGIPVALAVMDFSFMGGSMGSVVGEKITRLIEYATGEGLTLLIVSASGGARMQEGVFSLMQMAKISSALQIYQSCAKLLYISILTSPTTGGVTASFAMLGDIIFAEPKALIAFAGRRVIEQTLCEDLPDDFQTSEYMLHHGLVDLIVPRRFLRQALSETIRLYQNAPFKKRGEIPFGVQNPITFLTEEKIRRGWGRLTSPGTKAMFSKKNNSSKFQINEGLKESNFSGNEAFHFSSGESKHKTQKLHEPKQILSLKERKRGSITKLSRTSSDKNEAFRAKPKRIYREILTSFEIMLALFVSGNSKKQSKSSVSSEKLTPNNSSKDFINRKIKSSFWLYNNLILRAPNTFDNKNFANNRSKVQTYTASLEHSNRELSQTFVLPTFATRTQRIVGQYRKNQPLYSILKNDFACNTKQRFRREEGKASPKNLSIGFTSNHTLQKPTFLFRVSDAKLPFALKNENGNIPFVKSTTEKGFASQNRLSFLSASKTNLRFVSKAEKIKANRGNKKTNAFCSANLETLFSQKPGSLQSWKFSKLLGVAFTNKYFFKNFRKDSKALLFNKFLSYIKLASTEKSFEKNRFGVSNLHAKSEISSIRNQGKSYVRLKRSFVQQVIFDYGFSCTVVTNRLKNTNNNHTFGEDLAKMEPLRQSSYNEGQMGIFSSIKGTSSKSLHTDKIQEQNRADINVDMSSSSLLYNFRSLAQATLESNTLQTSSLQISPGQTSAEQKRNFYDIQNQVNMVGSVKETSFNRSAIGIKHTNYLRKRTFSFLQNKNNVGNKLNKNQNLVTRKNNNNFPAISYLSSDLSRKQREKSSVFLISSSHFNPIDVISPSLFSLRLPSLLSLSESRFSVISYKHKALLCKKLKKKANQNSNLLANKKDKTRKLNKSPYTSKNVSATDFTSAENDIDFLNQAIELAATESVEWRAFYIHQQLSENMGFLDDFLEQERINDNETEEQTNVRTRLKSISRPFPSQLSDARNQMGNVLYYQSLCRSKKLFST